MLRDIGREAVSCSACWGLEGVKETWLCRRYVCVVRCDFNCRRIKSFRLVVVFAANMSVNKDGLAKSNSSHPKLDYLT